MFERVCSSDDVWEGELKAFNLPSGEVIVVNVEGSLRAFDARCPHQGQSLAEADLEGSVLTCPAHQWEFDVKTGLGINPVDCKLRAYAIKVDGDNVLIDVDSAEPLR
jgi:toluene monooxygenase system ferredoxin subunit